MLRIFAAIILVSTLAGCVTTDGPYSRSNVTSLEPQRTVQVATPRAKPVQAAQVPQRQKIQVSLQQRAYGPQVRRADYPLILGAAF
jgi:hypothetical protein